MAFIKIGDTHINTLHIAFIEEVGGMFKVHLLNRENTPITYTASNANDGYADLRRWLDEQEHTSLTPAKV